MRGGILTTWLAFAMSLFATLFPDLVARGFLDDRRLVRWVAVPALLATGVLLVSYHTRWF
jgi:hypothetical protein